MMTACTTSGPGEQQSQPSAQQQSQPSAQQLQGIGNLQSLTALGGLTGDEQAPSRGSLASGGHEAAPTSSFILPSVAIDAAQGL